MIVICKHTNQLCNRLFTYLPTLSYAIEAGERVCFLFQYRGYADFFPNMREYGIRSYLPSRYLMRSGPLEMLFYGVVRGVDKVVHLVLKRGEALPLRKPLGVLFGAKWREIRYDAAYVAKHRETLTWLFAPPREVADVVRRDVVDCGDVETVGVHIRRGDYASYRPELLFEDAVFVRYIEKMERLIGAMGKRARFLICSDQAVDLSAFSGHDVFRMSKGGILYDLYGLAACRYIIGVPSTFSMWASFWGRVPLRHFEGADEEIRLEDFVVFDGVK